MPTMRSEHFVERALFDEILNQHVEGFLESLLSFLKSLSTCREIHDRAVSHKLISFSENINWN